MKRVFLAVFAGSLISGPMALAQNNDLPDIGSPSDAVLSGSKERDLGRMVVRQLRASGLIVEDPAVVEYIQNLGQRLAGHAHDGDESFAFFVVDDPQINAFALPGGFIGINAGLIMASNSESELAGVMAHEIAHVTQNHIARAIYDNQRTSLVTAAAMLAAILVGVTTDAGGDAIQGAVAAGQAAAVQRQINFTRSNEYEADRVGIGILANAGFDPAGMASFFETLARRYGFASRQIPSLLRTHPVTSDRVAEARSRARQLPKAEVQDSMNYGLVRARLGVRAASTADDAIADFRRRVGEDDASMADSYGLGLAYLRAARPDSAEQVFRGLLESDSRTIAFHTGRAEALAAGGQMELAREVYEQAIELFPRNVPLTISYAEYLINAGAADESHELLLDLLNNVAPTAEQIRLIARAANAAGDTGNAHFYMSHYYVALGNAPLALNQLHMAIESPGVDSVDRARYEARLAELRRNIPAKMLSEIDRIEPRPSP